MHWPPFGVGAPLLITVVTLLVLVVYIHHGRRRWDHMGIRGVTASQLLLLLSAVWAGGYYLELASPTLSGKRTFVGFQYLGMLPLPAVWFVYTVHLVGRRTWLTPAVRALLFAMPVAVLALAATNPLHHLVWSDMRLDASAPLPMLAIETGPAVTVWLTWTWILVATMAWVVARYRTSVEGLEARHVVALLVAGAAPLVGNLLEHAGAQPVAGLQLEPYTLLFMALSATANIVLYDAGAVASRARSLVVHRMDDPLVVLDNRGRVWDLNPAAEDLLGAELGKVDGVLVRDVLPDWPEALLRTDGDSLTPDLHFGGRVWDAVRLPLTDRQGVQSASAVVLRDVTERRKLAERAGQAQRLASIGTLAAGVAHELNNPLTWVLGNLRVLGEHLERPAEPPDEAASKELNSVLAETIDGVNRMVAIVADLRSYARSPVARGIGDVEQALERATKIAGAELRHRAQVVRSIRTVPPVAIDQGRLEQVLVNLLVNAAQAFQEEASSNRIEIGVAHDTAGNVRVSVTDNAGGMSEEVMSHAFDPFFTTKPPGRGTGLGLHVCRSLIQAAGGEIALESQPGTGTTVRLILPLADPRAPSLEHSYGSEEPEEALRPLRILVVDDERPITRALARLLKEHDVAVAHRGTEALAWCERTPFDIVFCDLSMPHMSGIELYQAIATQHPDLADRVVFMTGGVFNDETQAFLDRIDNAVIDKPFDVRRIRAILVSA